MRVVEVFQPAQDEYRQGVSIRRGQEGRPGQVNDLDDELGVDRLEVLTQDLTHGLTVRKALLVLGAVLSARPPDAPNPRQS